MVRGWHYTKLSLSSALLLSFSGICIFCYLKKNLYFVIVPFVLSFLFFFCDLVGALQMSL